MGQITQLPYLLRDQFSRRFTPGDVIIEYVGYSVLSAEDTDEVWTVQRINNTTGLIEYAYKIAWSDRATATYS